MASLYDRYKQEKTLAPTVAKTSSTGGGDGSLYSRFQQEQNRATDEAKRKEVASKMKYTEPAPVKKIEPGPMSKPPIKLAAPDKPDVGKWFSDGTTGIDKVRDAVLNTNVGKDIVKTVAGFGVKQFIEKSPIMGGGNVPFLSAAPKQYGQALSDSVKQGTAQYERLFGRLKDFAGVYIGEDGKELDGTEKTKRSLDAASSVLIDAGGAIFSGALNVIGATPAGKVGVENFGKLLEGTMNLAGGAASKGLQALPIDNDFKQKIDPSIREFAGAVAVGLLFKAAHTGGNKVKAKVESIGGFKSMFGIEQNKPITPGTVAEAYKLQTDSITAQGDLNKVDIINGLKPVMDEIARVGEANWNPETSPAMRAINQAVDVTTETLRADSDAIATTAKAEIVDSIINKPIDGETIAMRKAMDKDMQFAFENEIYDLNAKNDIDLAKKVESEAINFERIVDPFDERAGYYDAQTRTIKINEDRIQTLVDTLADGKKALKIQEGKLVTSFHKLADETLAELKTRLEDTIIRHETAHAKTITPEDLARMRVASELGDTPVLKKIRSEMEGKADRYTIENASKLLDDNLVKDINRATEATYARDNIKSQMDSQKYANDEMNAAYDQYKKLVDKNDKYYQAGEEAFRSQMRESPKYRNMTDVQFRQKWDGAMHRGVDGSGFMRIDDLFDTLRKRYDAEKKLKTQYDDLKKSQKGLFAGKERMDDRVRRAMREAIKTEKASQKTAGERTAFSKGRMFENIRGKVEKDIVRERMKTTVGKVRERYQKRYLRTQINDIVKRLLPKRTRGGRMTGKLTPDTQKFMIDVYKNRKANGAEAVSKAMDAIMAWRKENPANQYAEIPENLYRDLKLAEATGYLRQGVGDLKKTVEALKDMRSEAIAARKAKRDHSAQVAEGIANDLKKTVTGSEGFEIDPIKKQKALSKVKEGVKSWWYGTKTFNTLVDPLGRQIRELAKKSSDKADRVKNEYGRAHDDMVKVFEKEYGKKWVNEKADKMRNQVELGTFVDANGKKQTLRASRLEALDIYARRGDAKFNDNLYHKNGNAFTKEMTDKIFSILTDSDKRMADYLVKAYKDQYLPFSKAFKDVSGVDLGFTGGYAGRLKYVDDIRLQKDIEKGENVTDMTIADYSTRKGMSVQGGASRTGHVGQMRFSDDPFRDFLEYKRSTEHFIQMHDVMSTWDRVMADKNVTGAMDEKFGYDYINNVKLHLEDLRQGEIVRDKSIGVNRVFAAAQGNVSKALIQNPAVWAGQMADIAIFKSEAKNSGAFNKGVLNWREVQPLLKKYAPSVEARIRKPEAELIRRVEGTGSKAWRAIENLGDMGTAPIEFFDSKTTKVGAAGLFTDRVEFYKKLGESEEGAYKRAGRDVGVFIKDNLSTPDYLGKSNMEKRAGFGQVVTALRNQPNKIFHRLWTKVDQFKRGDISARELGHFIYWNNIVQPTMYYGMRTAVKQTIRGAKSATLRLAGADEAADREDERMASEDYKQGAAFSVVNNAFSGFILGDIVQTLVLENLVGGKNYELRPSTISAMTEDITGGISELKDGDIGSAMAKTSRGILRSVGIGDPLDMFGSILAETAKADKERKAAAKKTPEARIDAKKKAAEKKIAEAQKARKK